MDLIDLLDPVLKEWQEKSKKAIYKTDPEAWAADVLGERWWSKQREIAHDYISSPRVAIKSANGTGKSRLVGGLITHWVSVHEPGEVIAIASAPTISQIQLVVFDWLKKNYGAAKARGFLLPGQINESLEWKAKTENGSAFMVVGRKPQDQDLVGSFQGVRRDEGTAVFIDEAGSVPADLFTAAEVVTTGGGNHKIVAIGNPDQRGTAFFDLWNKSGVGDDWKLHTISAFDLPTFTGEIVYPDDPDRQREMLKSGMNTPEKIETWRKMWGEKSARWQAKVLGEFPDEADNTFFSQEIINRGFETEIEEDPDIPLVLGVDVALGGLDETIVYGNRGGRIRFMTSWSKHNSVIAAQQIHDYACEVGASVVQIDAGGTGQGVYENMYFRPEFASKPYRLYGISGGKSSPDNTLWAQARAWHYDIFRSKLTNGEIDLDVTDKELYEEMISQTYQYNNRNALQITPKKEARKNGIPSPDHLDAVIYSVVPSEEILSGPAPGTKRRIPNEEILANMVSSDPFPY